jgi:endonuclease V-like protein UPF0215 family
MVIRKVKEEIRILGIDDAPHEKNDKKVLLVGTVFRAGSYLDGIISEWINKDGKDSTEKIIRMFKKTGHKDQIRILMLNGVTFGGFNVADIKKINKQTKTPVIVVIRDEPNFDAIKKALRRVEDSERKWKLHEKAGEIKSIKIKSGKVYFQHVGINEFQAREIIKKTCTHSNYPEPLRIAHIIGAGIVLGRSRRGK